MLVEVKGTWVYRSHCVIWEPGCPSDHHSKGNLSYLMLRDRGREGGRQACNRLSSFPSMGKGLAATHWTCGSAAVICTGALDFAFKWLSICIVKSHLCFTFALMSFHSAAQEQLQRDASSFRGQCLLPNRNSEAQILPSGWPPGLTRLTVVWLPAH